MSTGLYFYSVVRFPKFDFGTSKLNKRWPIALNGLTSINPVSEENYSKKYR